jgi:hypothetical protein
VPRYRHTVDSWLFIKSALRRGARVRITRVGAHILGCGHDTQTGLYRAVTIRVIPVRLPAVRATMRT